jgi:hypothetical protein
VKSSNALSEDSGIPHDEGSVTPGKFTAREVIHLVVRLKVLAITKSVRGSVQWLCPGISLDIFLIIRATRQEGEGC